MAEDKEKPLTREDVLRLIEALAPKEKGHELVLNRECVLRLIEENGGPENELDLSEMKFQRGIDLHDIDIKRIILTGARLVEAHLEGADLRETHLDKANLRYIHLEEADLRDSHLEKADLRGAHLKAAHLEKAILRSAHLEKAILREAHLEVAFLAGAHLEEADLGGAHLEGATLVDAHLEGAFLGGAHLEGTILASAHLEGAFLGGAHLERAELKEAHLEGAELWGACLEGAYLWLANFSRDTKLENVYWRSYILGEEKDGLFEPAADVYRRLKTWYTNAGMYDVAGEFFFREMEAKRKYLSWLQPQERRWLGWWPLRGQKARLNVYKWLYGYGERPWRIVAWGLLVLFGSALLYFFLRGVAPHTFSVQTFLTSLYYSAVSFTALGYGPWFTTSSVRGWAQGVGAAEAIIGVFTIALFLVTFTRKMIR